MNQIFRFFLRPWAFFSQLQWSRNHWAILCSFLGIAFLEAQIGKQHAMYSMYTTIVANRFDVSPALALWVVTFAKLALMLTAASVLATVIWLVGSFFGDGGSRRVLARRLAVVFTVLLAGFTAHHMIPTEPNFAAVSLGLYAWGLLLGYFALREQFGLNHLETMVLGLFAALAVTTTWHYSNNLLEVTAKRQAIELTARPVPAPMPSRLRK